VPQTWESDPGIDIDSNCYAAPIDADGPVEDTCGNDATTYIFRSKRGPSVRVPGTRRTSRPLRRDGRTAPARCRVRTVPEANARRRRRPWSGVYRMSALDDVSIDEADLSRIDYLSSGDISREEAERIVRFAKLDPPRRTPDMLSADETGARPAYGGGDEDATEHTGTDGGVVCGDVRRLMREADRPADVCDEYPNTHPSRIFAHAEGRCRCDTDEPPTTSPRVGPDECSDIRDAFRAGATKSDIESDFNRSTNAINKHLFGRCDHDVGRDDQTSSRLGRKECAHARDVYRRNGRVDFEALAAAFRVSPSTAHRHVRGVCDHDIDVPPVPSGVTPNERCKRMRRRYKSDPDETTGDDRDRFETSRPTADYHIFGRCACDHDEPPASRH